MGNCYGCKFAVEARNHLRHGEQVRCKRAEEIFGGIRWVDALEESRCGEFQPFKGDTVLNPTEVEPAECTKCNGTGVTVVQYMSGPKKVTCLKCGGLGVY